MGWRGVLKGTNGRVNKAESLNKFYMKPTWRNGHDRMCEEGHIPPEVRNNLDPGSDNVDKSVGGTLRNRDITVPG